MTRTEALAGSDVRPLTPQDFAWIKDFLYERTGIDLKPGKEAMVMGRLDRRLRHHGLTRYRDYLTLLNEDLTGEEAQFAVDLLTTNETYFFREPAHFELLATILGGIRHRSDPVRVWSAASSSGEEAYSVAMVLADLLPEQIWSVVGTDISGRVVQTAQRGVYPLEAAPKIPRALLQAYCLKGRDEYEGLLAIAPQVRRQVTFRQANLLELPSDLGLFDVIFLRNVMIYFDLPTKQSLVNRVETMLKPGGHLLISHSESLNGITTGLSHVKPSVYRSTPPDG